MTMIMTMTTVTMKQPTC